MSAADPFRILALVLLLGPVFPSPATDLPDEPRPEGSLRFPGRLPWGASALPTGELLAPCEDEGLSVLGDKAQALARWQAPARFSGPVTVAPRGPLQLLAAPLVTGTVEVLAWDSRTETLVPVFSPAHGTEALATAWGASGTLYAAWKGGEVEAWEPHGNLLWSVNTGTEVRGLLFDESLGTYAVCPGQVILYDFHGKETGRWALDGTPRDFLQTMSGDLFCWTETGLWRKGPDDPGFAVFDKSTRLLGVAVDRQDRMILTDPERIRRFSPEGNLISDIELPDHALTAGVIDDRGRILVGTTKGMEAWAYDGRFLGTLDPVPPASALILTDRGFGLWSSADWSVHLWSGFHRPPYGWPQAGGGPGRPYSARRPASLAIRIPQWADSPEFGYFYQLASSGEESKQREVLDQFEARFADGTLLSRWPFANLILLKIAQAGLTDLVHDPVRLTNNWPGFRLRAYRILGGTAGPEDRNELMELLRREFDPLAAAQGALALARSGWDGDGKLMRLLFELQARMPQQAVVADGTVDAARLLWVSNGRSTDPSMVPLVTAVFQGPFPRKVKLKAQTFFQDLMTAP